MALWLRVITFHPSSFLQLLIWIQLGPEMKKYSLYVAGFLPDIPD